MEADVDGVRDGVEMEIYRIIKSVPFLRRTLINTPNNHERNQENSQRFDPTRKL